jgi:hypothetical protein
MITRDVKVGDILEIGDQVSIKVKEKSGQRVRLVIATAISPIKMNETGVMPERYATGLTGESRHVSVPDPEPAE